MTLGRRWVDSKNFSEHTFASFLEWNFGLEFADPRGIWRIRRITAEIFRNLANSRCDLQKWILISISKNRHKAFLKNGIS